ncbi:Extreme acid sensitivity protein [Providencia alcalifaciens]|nr:Extreme acid sensitivity protein [Providencia alcalifaciens]
MATSTAAPAAKQLTLLGFFAITASMVMAVYEYPTFATSGFSLVFFLLLGDYCGLFLLPSALPKWQLLKAGRKAVFSRGYPTHWESVGDLQLFHLAIYKLR